MSSDSNDYMTFLTQAYPIADILSKEKQNEYTFKAKKNKGYKLQQNFSESDNTKISKDSSWIKQVHISNKIILEQVLARLEKREEKLCETTSSFGLCHQ